MSQTKKGILLMLLFSLFLSIMIVFLKKAGHIPVAEKVVYRNGIAACFAFFVIVGKHGFKDRSHYLGNRQNLLGLSLRTVFGLVGISLNLYALQYLLVPNATMIQDLSIFFVLLFSSLFLGEKIKWWQLAFVCLAFIGSVFVVNPESTKFVLLPSLAALLGAAMNGGDSATMRYLRDKCDPVTLVFWYNFVSALILVPFMIHDYQPLPLNTLLYLGLAGLCYIVVEFSLILAYKFAPAKDIALFRYTDVIFAAILGFFVFGHLPSLSNLFGYILIVLAAVLLIITKERQATRHKIINNAD